MRKNILAGMIILGLGSIAQAQSSNTDRQQGQSSTTQGQSGQGQSGQGQAGQGQSGQSGQGQSGQSQSGQSQSASSQSSQGTSPVTGCLQRGSGSGEYTLTGSDGK